MYKFIEMLFGICRLRKVNKKMTIYSDNKKIQNAKSKLWAFYFPISKIIFCCLLLIFIFLPLLLFSAEAWEHYNKAWEAIKNEKFSEAKANLENAIQKDQKNHAYHRDMGWLHYEKLNQPEKGLLYLKAAEALKNDDALLYLYMGNAYSKLKKTDNALNS